LSWRKRKKQRNDRGKEAKGHDLLGAGWVRSWVGRFIDHHTASAVTSTSASGAKQRCSQVNVDHCQAL
jgi:hypothetical protein